jgi:hypothetical protein
VHFACDSAKDVPSDVKDNVTCKPYGYLRECCKLLSLLACALSELFPSRTLPLFGDFQRHDKCHGRVEL